MFEHILHVIARFTIVSYNITFETYPLRSEFSVRRLMVIIDHASVGIFREFRKKRHRSRSV